MLPNLDDHSWWRLVTQHWNSNSPDSLLLRIEKEEPYLPHGAIYPPTRSILVSLLNENEDTGSRTSEQASHPQPSLEAFEQMPVQSTDTFITIALYGLINQLSERSQQELYAQSVFEIASTVSSEQQGDEAMECKSTVAGLQSPSPHHYMRPLSNHEPRRFSSTAHHAASHEDLGLGFRPYSPTFDLYETAVRQAHFLLPYAYGSASSSSWTHSSLPGHATQAPFGQPTTRRSRSML